MMQISCFKHGCIIRTSNQLDGLVKPKLFACVVSELVRLKGNVGRICFYPRHDISK